jgi:hypothetical protein
MHGHTHNVDISLLCQRGAYHRIRVLLRGMCMYKYTHVYPHVTALPRHFLAMSTGSISTYQYLSEECACINTHTSVTFRGMCVYKYAHVHPHVTALPRHFLAMSKRTVSTYRYCSASSACIIKHVHVYTHNSIASTFSCDVNGKHIGIAQSNVHV